MSWDVMALNLAVIFFPAKRQQVYHKL